jgi:hypothetical protein
MPRTARPSRAENWLPITPVPAHAPAAVFKHFHYPVESIDHTAVYQIDGRLYGYVVRFRKSDGGKEPLPYTWCQSDRDGTCAWRWKMWDEPRPLYVPAGALPPLAAGVTVVLVEGEKKAELLHLTLALSAPGRYLVVTWPGGCGAWKKAHWAWLHGCSVLLWPDADAKREQLTVAERKQFGADDGAARDALAAEKPFKPESKQPGMAAMLGIGALLATKQACTVALLPIPKPGTVASGWDCADAIIEKWDFGRLEAFFGSAAPLVLPPAEKPAKNDSGKPAMEPEAFDLPADGESLLLSNGGAVLPCEHNAYLILAGAAQYKALYFDEFLSRPRFGDRDWIDTDDLDAVRWLQRRSCVAKFSPAQTRHAARSLAYARRRDSLREFVEALPAWDQVPRIEFAFIDAWGAPDSLLSHAASANFFIALIARALKPGAQVDTLWVFEGPQETFKSKSLRELGGSFHAEVSAPLGSADFQRELRGLWLAELSELDSMRGKEASTIKRILSAPSDRFVQKYALLAESYPRRAVAVATTNEATYWQDPTGARRLVPISCGEIRVDLIKQTRLQWFAEARHRYAAGETWWEFPREILDEQEARQEVDPWENILADAIANGRSVGWPVRENWPEGEIATSEIARTWLELKPFQQTAATGVRIGKIMRRLGFVPVRIGDRQVRGWRLA